MIIDNGFILQVGFKTVNQVQYLDFGNQTGARPLEYPSHGFGSGVGIPNYRVPIFLDDHYLLLHGGVTPLSKNTIILYLCDTRKPREYNFTLEASSSF